MPSKSKKQHDFMAAVANNPKFAKQAGVPQSVGEEFMKMDKKMKSYAKGGMSSCGTKSKPTAMKKGGKLAAGGMAKAKTAQYTLPKGSMYEMAREAEMERDRKYRTREDRYGLKEVPWRELLPSESVQTMRRQQKELDSRMADMPMMRKGGKVRGAGMAKKGVRPCKIC